MMVQTVWNKHGWLIVCVFATAISLLIAWELQSGVAYHKTGGPSYRASRPGLFWFEIAFQTAVALLVWLFAYRRWRRTKIG